MAKTDLEAWFSLNRTSQGSRNGFNDWRYKARPLTGCAGSSLITPAVQHFSNLIHGFEEERPAVFERLWMDLHLWLVIRRFCYTIRSQSLQKDVLSLLKKKNILLCILSENSYLYNTGGENAARFIYSFVFYFLHTPLYFQGFFLLCWTWRQWQTSQLMPLVVHLVRKCSANWWSTCQDSPSGTLSVESATRGASNRLVGGLTQTLARLTRLKMNISGWVG